MKSLIQSMDIFTVVLIIPACLLCLLHSTVDAACRKDQIDSCKKAAEDNDLERFHAGGTCVNKHYVQFTHVCTVKQYMPSTDFCCCVTEKKVLCCQYHQYWGDFRCTQADDTIDTISSSSSNPFNKVIKKLPLEILIPAIVAVVVLVICCVACVIKCCFTDYDAEGNYYCGIPCLKSCRHQSPEKPYPCQAPQRRDSRNDEEQPLSSHASRCLHPNRVGSQFSSESTTSETKLLPSRSHDSSIPLPSAPPTNEGVGDDSAFVRFYTDGGCLHNHHAGYNRLESESSSIVGDPYRCGYSRSVSSGLTNQNINSGGEPCPSCAGSIGCPPPTYDEHHKDRVLS